MLLVLVCTELTSGWRDSLISSLVATIMIASRDSQVGRGEWWRRGSSRWPCWLCRAAWRLHGRIRDSSTELASDDEEEKLSLDTKTPCTLGSISLSRTLRTLRTAAFDEDCAPQGSLLTWSFRCAIQNAKERDHAGMFCVENLQHVVGTLGSKTVLLHMVCCLEELMRSIQPLGAWIT